MTSPEFRTPRRIVITAAAAIAVIAVAAVYYLYNPAAEGAGWFPRCPWLMLTGLKCPGCGSQRAIHALLHADVAAAWRYNAALIISLPLIAVLLWGETVRRSRPDTYRRLNSTRVIITTFSLIALWWILRNIFGW